MHERRLHRLTAALGVAALLAMASPAAAHTELVAADPAPGSTLDAAPAQVVLTFDGEVQVTGDAVVVAGTDGSTYQGDEARVGPANVVSVDLAPLPPDVYTVQYRAVADDGHVAEGSFQFAVAPAPTVPVAAAPVASTLVAAAVPSGPTAGTAGGDDDDSPIGLPLLVVAGIVGAVGAGAAMLVGRRTSPPE